MTFRFFSRSVLWLGLAAASAWTTPALSQSTVEDRILDLVHDIQRDVTRGRATQYQLEQAERKLEDVLDLVRGRDPNDPDDPNNPDRRFITLNDLSFVVGLHAQYDSAQALATWESACSQLENHLSSLYGSDRLQSFSCGTPENVSPWASQAYYLYASTATAVVLAIGRDITEQADRSISSDNIQYELDTAYRGWASRCIQRLQAVKSQFGERFVAGSCGAPRNVSPYASQGYYQFQSQLRVWIKSL